MRKVEVGPTAVGRGVFAQRSFEPEEVIGQVRGTIIRQPGYGSDYCMELAGGLILEPHPPFKFLNHSCDPNCQLFVWEDEADNPVEVPRLRLQAIRVVRPGEELSIDYAWPADSAIPCQCNSPRCRGWIVDLEELDQVQENGLKLEG